MISIRKAIDRGHANHGWLQSHHTFSFADYYHPDHMSYRALRVINEDVVAPGAGFPPHSHRDMEIITYVLEGAVAHQDSTGGGGVIRPGEVQYMCAGGGVTHSEYNASKTDPLHLYQIWILPNAKGLKAGYAQKSFGDERNGVFRLVASPDGRDGSLTINQDASLYASVLTEGDEIEHPLAKGRYGWLQVAKGGVEIGGAIMQAGDAAKIEDEKAVSLKALAPKTELLFFDLA
jgi:redox-sensitive bicupin YhaK (pirin superfamily)